MKVGVEDRRPIGISDLTATCLGELCDVSFCHFRWYFSEVYPKLISGTAHANWYVGSRRTDFANNFSWLVGRRGVKSSLRRISISKLETTWEGWKPSWNLISLISAMKFCLSHFSCLQDIFGMYSWVLLLRHSRMIERFWSEHYPSCHDSHYTSIR